MSYVVRDEAQPRITDQDTREEKAAILNDLEYQQDTKTVHHMIFRIIADDSDTYTYVKSILDQKDRRKDVIAQKERYYNSAT